MSQITPVPVRGNYHTHSCYCDGKATPRQMVDFAVAHGFTHLGFSGHSPLPYQNSFSIPGDKYIEYCDTVRTLRQEYADRIEIMLGLEIDYVPGLCEDFRPLVEQGGLQYTIGSIHLIPPEEHVPYLRKHPEEAAQYLWMIDGPRYETYDEGLQRLFGGDIHRAVRTFFNQNNRMIESQKPTIVGHFDKIVMHNRDRYFHYDEPWFRNLVYETVQLIHETGCICEVNTRGIYKGRHYDYYPAKETLKHMNTLGIPVIVSTDAHAPEDLLRTEGAYEFLDEIHYSNLVSKLDPQIIQQ